MKGKLKGKPMSSEHEVIEMSDAARVEVERAGLSAAHLEAIAECGGRVTTVAEFLGETPAETAYIEMSLRLSRLFRAERGARGLTQMQAAKLLGIKQSYVARLETFDRSTTLDALIKALLGLGVVADTLGAALGGAEPQSVVEAATGEAAATGELVEAA